jgi:hypothetical protein
MTIEEYNSLAVGDIVNFRNVDCKIIKVFSPVKPWERNVYGATILSTGKTVLMSVADAGTMHKGLPAQGGSSDVSGV